MSNDQAILNNLKDDLKSKSIEELIYLNFNPSFYVEKSTQNLREQNENLIAELGTLNKNYQENKAKYDNIINMLNDYKKQYAQKEKELNELIQKKKMIDGQITVDGLQKALKNYIDTNYAKPKQKLTSDFLNGKVNLNDFTEKFKELNQNFHYYSIIKDKLNLCKQNEKLLNYLLFNK